MSKSKVWRHGKQFCLVSSSEVQKIESRAKARENLLHLLGRMLFCDLDLAHPEVVDELERQRLAAMPSSQLYQTQAADDGGTMYSTMCSSVGSEQRGGHRNPPLSRQATSAELIASIRFSTRPEDILYLHLKDVREQLAAFYARACPRKLLETYEGNLTAVDRILQSYIELGCSDLAMERLNAELRLKYGCGLEILPDLAPPQKPLVVTFSDEASPAHAPNLSPSIDHASSSFPPRMQPSNGCQTPFASTETLSSMSRQHQHQQQQQQQQQQWPQRSPRRHLPSAAVLQIRSADHDERGENQLRGPSVQQSLIGGGKQPRGADADRNADLHAHHRPLNQFARTRMAWIGNRKMTVKSLHSYSPTNLDEVPFEKGAVIECSGESDDGWLWGEHRGRAGLIPANYVTVISPRASYAASSSLLPPGPPPRSPAIGESANQKPSPPSHPPAVSRLDLEENNGNHPHSRFGLAVPRSELSLANENKVHYRYATPTLFI